MTNHYEKRVEDARRRQANPGEYALLHANGMGFPELVALISTDVWTLALEDDGDE